MRYCPVPSEMALRVLSISAGLEASTVTPGSTAPDESFTTPVIDAWAYAEAGTASHTRTNATLFHTVIHAPFTQGRSIDDVLNVGRAFQARQRGDPERVAPRTVKRVQSCGLARRRRCSGTPASCRAPACAACRRRARRRTPRRRTARGRGPEE